MQTNQLPITFEAHYWGTFQLTALPESWDVYGQIPYPIARSVGFGPKVSILYDPPSGHLFLSNQSERPIAFSAEEFFDVDQVSSANKNQVQHFDLRKSLEGLLSPTDYLITNINDPEQFEEVRAYLELVEQFEELAAGDILFSGKTGRTIADHQKEIILSSGKKSWQIDIQKELFDNQIVDSLNEILQEKEISAYRFATTINPKMRMVLLKLSPEKYDLLDRMGLLV